MNSKNYESFFLIWIFFFIFIIGFIGTFIFSIFTSNIRKYQMITGLVSDKNQIMLFVSYKQLHWLYRNQVVLIDGKKVNFSIDRNLPSTLSKKNQEFYQVYLSVPIKNYSINDTIIVGFLQERVTFLSVFFEMWKGG